MGRYILIFILFFTTRLTAQVSGGVTGIYNFQTESIGIGARAIVREQKQIQFSPQFSYFFPGNKINEWTIGCSVQYRFFKTGKFQSYALAHGGYNRWTNFEDSFMKDAKLNNWNGEVGVGIILGKRVRPFAEWRYNTKYREASIQVGLLFNKNSFKGKNEKCAAYD